MKRNQVSHVAEESRFRRHANLYLRLLVGVCGLFGAGVVWYFVKSATSLTPKQDVWVSVGTTVAISAVIFLLAEYILRKFNDDQLGLLIRKEVSAAVNTNCVLSIETTPWDELIGNAKSIQLVVQGWSGWFQTPDVIKALPDFIRRGGKLTIYLYHYEDAKAAALHDAWKQRKVDGTIWDEMGGTIASAYEAYDEAAKEIPLKEDALRIQLLTATNWYCAANFSPGPLLISPYAHFHKRVKIAPVAIIEKYDNPTIEEWLKREDEYFVRNSEICDRVKFEVWYEANKPKRKP